MLTCRMCFQYEGFSLHVLNTFNRIVPFSVCLFDCLLLKSFDGFVIEIVSTSITNFNENYLIFTDYVLLYAFSVTVITALFYATRVFIRYIFCCLGIQTTSPGIASAFQPFHTEADDPFTASLNVSDADRRYDAWIPSDATRHILISMATSSTGTTVTPPEQLCTPSLMLDTPQVKILVCVN